MSEMITDINQVFLVFFPFLFTGVWLLVTSVLGALSGWFILQRRYPRGQDRPALQLRCRSGKMGLGVAMGGILSLGACPTGLRVGISRLFGPFQRPFLIPWDEITAEPKIGFFIRTARLRLGRPEAGVLTIDARLWQRLRRAGLGAEDANVPPVSVATAGRGYLLQWLAVSAGAGCFFSIASRANASQPGLPLALCFGWPATMFGVVFGSRFLRQLR